mgnify:CR=1 FL=1
MTLNLCYCHRLSYAAVQLLRDMTLYQRPAKKYNLRKNLDGSGMLKKALSHKYLHLIADDDNIEKIIRS